MKKIIISIVLLMITIFLYLLNKEDNIKIIKNNNDKEVTTIVFKKENLKEEDQEDIKKRDITRSFHLDNVKKTLSHKKYLNSLDKEMEEGYYGDASSFEELSLDEKESLLRMSISEVEIKANVDLYNSSNEEGFLSFLGNNPNGNFNKLRRNKDFNIKTGLLTRLLKEQEDALIMDPELEDKLIVIYDDLLLYNAEYPKSDYIAFLDEYHRLREEYLY